MTNGDNSTLEERLGYDPMKLAGAKAARKYIEKGGQENFGIAKGIMHETALNAGYARDDPYVASSLNDVDGASKNVISTYERGKNEKSVSQLIDYYNSGDDSAISFYFDNADEREGVVNYLRNEFGDRNYGEFRKELDKARYDLEGIERGHVGEDQLESLKSILQNYGRVDYLFNLFEKKKVREIEDSAQVKYDREFAKNLFKDQIEVSEE